MSEATRIEIADHAPHILVVDDDKRLRELLARFLGEQGYRVTTAASAADAQAKSESLVFDAIVLDVMMPGENGFDYARRVRATSHVPILMLTARANPADRVTGLEIGADDYLPKPFEPRELILRLEQHPPAREPAARAGGDAARGRVDPFRAVRLPPRSRRAAPRRRGHPPHRSRTRDPEHPRAQGRRQRHARGTRQRQRRQRTHGRRADQPPAPQDRGRSRQSGVPADRARRRLSPPRRAMMSASTLVAQPSHIFRALRALARRVDAERALCPLADHHHRAGRAPAVGHRLRVHGTTLGAGDAPPVVRGDVRHRRPDRHLRDLPAGTARTRSWRASRPSASGSTSTSSKAPICRRPARSRSSPCSTRRSRTRSASRSDGRSGSIRSADPSLIEIRVKLTSGVMRVIARRSQAYASNSHIFLFWMAGTSLVLLGIAILFLRNQIRPILRLAEVAESFGKGRDDRVPAARRPRGAAGGPRLPRDEAPHRARHRAAHDHAERGQPRPPHHPDALQAVPGHRRADARGRGHEEGHRRDEPHARRLSGLRPRRRRRAGRRDGSARAAVRPAERRRAPGGFGHRGGGRRPDGHGAPGRLPAHALQPRLERRRATARRSPSRPTTRPAGSSSTSTTTARAFRRESARRCSSLSCGSTRRATRTRAAPASASPSPATWRARTAATSCSATVPSGACAPPCACRPSLLSPPRREEVIAR